MNKTLLICNYRILPNKRAGAFARADLLSFLAFQWWFRIENRSNIKGDTAIFVE